MNKEALIDLLEDLAEKDLEDGADISDHPCSIAVRALDQCYSDIAILRSVAERTALQSKQVQVLIAMNYDPKY